MSDDSSLNSQDYGKLVLASSSPRRRSLIDSLNISVPVSVLAPDADESILPEWRTPAQIVEQLSLRKAYAARQILRMRDIDSEPAIIVGADTIVVLDGAVMGKPENAEEAKGMLSLLQGRSHEVYSGIACIETAGNRELVSHRSTLVYMKPLDPLRIERYVASGEPMDKAGSYAIQGLGAALIDRIEGCYFNVVGLSLSLLADLLSEYGIEVI